MAKRANFLQKGSWVNRHQSYEQTIEGYYSFSQSPDGDELELYNGVTKELQDMIAEAIQTGKSLRAMGSSWSLSKVGVTEHRLINTKNLSLAFTLADRHLSPAYAGDPTKLRFLETGNEIVQVNRYLFDQGLSLKASGSNNGQTLPGVISTGTHGSAFKFGATQDFIVGIHLITGPSKHVYLQRASYPVVKPSFAAALGAELKNDDTLFNAALVSFGSFGIIHGLMIEARERFLLHAFRSWHAFDEPIKKAISSLDFSELRPFEDLHNKPASQLYHFQVHFLPNEGTPPDEVSVTVMFEEPYTDAYRPPSWGADKAGPGASGLEVMGALLGAVPDPLQKFVKSVLNPQVRSYLDPYEVKGTFLDLFRGEIVRGKVFVSALGLPLSSALDALAVLFNIYKDFGTILPMTYTMRFVKGTEALLGFTKFDPTCVLEVDGLNTPRMWDYARAVWNKLEQEGIPFTMHWGKFNDFLTKPRLQNMYGTNLDKWIQSREQLLTPEVRQVFTNEFLRNVGLAT